MAHGEAGRHCCMHGSMEQVGGMQAQPSGHMQQERIVPSAAQRRARPPASHRIAKLTPPPPPVGTAAPKRTLGRAAAAGAPNPPPPAAPKPPAAAAPKPVLRAPKPPPACCCGAAWACGGAPPGPNPPPPKPPGWPNMPAMPQSKSHAGGLLASAAAAVDPPARVKSHFDVIWPGCNNNKVHALVLEARVDCWKRGLVAVPAVLAHTLWFVSIPQPFCAHHIKYHDCYSGIIANNWCQTLPGMRDRAVSRCDSAVLLSRPPVELLVCFPPQWAQPDWHRMIHAVSRPFACLSGSADCSRSICVPWQSDEAHRKVRSGLNACQVPCCVRHLTPTNAKTLLSTLPLLASYSLSALYCFACASVILSRQRPAVWLWGPGPWVLLSPNRPRPIIISIIITQQVQAEHQEMFPVHRFLEECSEREYVFNIWYLLLCVLLVCISGICSGLTLVSTSTFAGAAAQDLG